MSVVNYGGPGVVSKYVVRVCPGCGCTPSLCSCSSASLDTSAVDYLSDLMGHIPDPLDIATTGGSSGTTDTDLIAWTESDAYQMIQIQYDLIDTDLIVSADVLWPDGSLGILVINYVGGLFDSYAITHVDSLKTIIQSPVTRNIDGYITDKPALVVV